MSFDEQPDGDIHGNDALPVDSCMKMTVHAAHYHAMLVAALEGLNLPNLDFWTFRHPADLRALTSAICTQAKRVNIIEHQLDACRPYLKEGETVDEALGRLSNNNSSGLSWNGHNIYGDADSIKEARDAIEYKASRFAAHCGKAIAGQKHNIEQPNSDFYDKY